MGRFGRLALGLATCAVLTFVAGLAGAVTIKDVKPGEDVLTYVQREKGGFDQTLYQQVIGAGNAFKEGDQAIGVAADDDRSRENARILLANTKIRVFHEHPLFVDSVQKLIWNSVDPAQYEKIKDWTLGDLKKFILEKPQSDIKAIMYGLDSDAIGSVVKIMSNDELIAAGQKIFNNLPGSKIGAKGYLSARIQPNSPTDNPEDIKWQVFDGWSYAVGDLVLGTNPVDSTEPNVARIEKTLKDIIDTFGSTGGYALERAGPHRRPISGGKAEPRHHRDMVPEPCRYRKRQQNF